LANNIITVNAHLQVLPKWLTINNKVSFSLPLKSAKELAKKLLEADDVVEIELNFSSGKEKETKTNN
jgi:hypothetical protein